MKIRLKLQNDVARSLGVSAYVIQPDFNFTQALVHAISIEGLYDHLDELPAHYSPSISPASTSPLSSPLLLRYQHFQPLSQRRNSARLLLTNQMRRNEKSSAESHAARGIRRGRGRKQAPKTPTPYLLANSRPNILYPAALLSKFNFRWRTTLRLRQRRTLACWMIAVRGGTNVVAEGAEVKRFRSYQGSTAPSTTVPLVDTEHRVVGLVAYGDSSITQCAEEAAKLIRETRPAAVFTGKGIDNRRGNFGNLNAGVAHGGGRVRPQNIVNDEANAAVVDTLINSVPFQRLSGYATGIFKSWAPRLYKYCSTQFEYGA
ncbi:hypothetical protein BDP27DRAFT_1378154 [Rhodocollybia butyracea]|uniref:Uncharacterized protein n=1 Tax=Rhodocollybia butyracea TaxID=206335 RepID=A0A9P5TWE5_9AGAR|nr:hypothetical protein BDP27DRAFT_1378154 [Rhodocollybia butyracea]